MSKRHSRTTRGRHAKHTTLAQAAGTTVVAAAVVVAACGGVANAEPTQPGVTTSPSQPGVATTPSQPGVSTGPVQTWVPIPIEYQQPTQPLNNWDYESGEYQPTVYDNTPVDYSQLHFPTPLTEFTAPIAAPDKKIRIGKFLMDQPNWVSDDTADRTNGQTAVIEAQVTDFWRSLGIETDAAQRLSAAQLTGGVTGAVIGATALGVPATATGAVIGALAGGTVGGIAGAGLGAVLVPIPGVGLVTAGVAGTALGAGIGAAVGGAALGVPATLLGAAGGAAIGVLGATAYGTGDLGAPIDVEVADIDQPAITAQTEQVLQSWDATPPVGTATADAVRTAAQWAPAVDQQIRANVAALPGGEQLVTGFDRAVTDFQNATAIPGLPVGMIADAIGTGIPA